MAEKGVVTWCAAAVQAAALGVTTLLLTPGPWLGGMLDLVLPDRSDPTSTSPDGHELSCLANRTLGKGSVPSGTSNPVERDGLDQNWVDNYWWVCFGFRPETAGAHCCVRGSLTNRRWTGGRGCTLHDVQMTGDRITTLRDNHIDVDCLGGALTNSPQRGDRRQRPRRSDRQAVGPSLGLGRPMKRGTNPVPSSASRLKSDPFFMEQEADGQSPTWVSLVR